MTNVVKLVFANSAGKKMTWNLPDPKSDLTKATVATAMDEVIMKEIPLVNNDPDNIEIDDAYIYQTEKIDLA
jgi:hypothetical protein